MAKHARTKKWRRFGVIGAVIIFAFVAIANGAFGWVGSAISSKASHIVRGTPHRQSSTLVLLHQWPNQRCTFAATAMAKDGPSASDFPKSGQGDVNTAVIAAGGGAYGFGSLALNLSLSGAGTADILAMEPVIYSRNTDAPSWVIEPLGDGCGSDYMRLFQLDLDKPRPILVDKGIDSGVDGSKRDPTVPVASFGDTFTVSQKSPANIRVWVYTCHSTSHWGIRVKYLLDGRVGWKTMGPFISFAGAAPTFASSVSPDGVSLPLKKSGVIARPSDCGQIHE